MRARVNRTPNLVEIAHCLELKGRPVEKLRNRIELNVRSKQCNDIQMRDAIFEVIEHFGML